MRDVIWTIILVWLVYRIVNAVRGSGNIVINKHDHHHHYNSERKIKIDSTGKTGNGKKNNNSEGEYVDYEEIK